MALEEEFECESPDEEAEKITSVQQAIDYIKAHVKAGRPWDIPGACAGPERRHGAFASCRRVVQAGAAIAASGVSGAHPPRRGPRIAIESATESAMSKRRVVIPGLGIDRKSVVWGKSGSVRVDHGGRRIIKKKTKQQ